MLQRRRPARRRDDVTRLSVRRRNPAGKFERIGDCGGEEDEADGVRQKDDRLRVRREGRLELLSERCEGSDKLGHVCTQGETA